MRLSTVLANVPALLASDEWASPTDLDRAAEAASVLTRRIVTGLDIEIALRSAGVESNYAYNNRRNYRIKHARHDAAREAIRAAYRLTDREIPAEYRASAWTQIVHQLRGRWVRGNFSIPTDDTMRPWCVGARASDPKTWLPMDAAPFEWPAVVAQAVAA